MFYCAEDIPPVEIGTHGNDARGHRPRTPRVPQYAARGVLRAAADALHSAPVPEPFLRNLTVGVLEVFAGVREVDQLARWLTEDAYRKLVARANLAARARSARGVAAKRPVHTILSVHESSPADGIIEAVVVVRGPARTRALAVRIEGMDGRWRATSLALL